MKKFFFTIALVFTMVCGANAQTDGFFGGDGGGYDDRAKTMPLVPGDGVGTLTHDENAANAPLGDGLVVLTVLGVGYALKMREKSSDC